MKRIIPFLKLAALAILSGACAKEMIAPVEVSRGVNLELSCLRPLTKAGTKATTGDDAFNENDILTLDYFIYSDANGTSLVRYGHATAEDLKDKSGAEGVKIYSVPVLDSDTDIVEGSTYYVYVVANSTVVFSEADAASLSLVKSKVHEADFKKGVQTSFVMDNINPISFKAGTNPVAIELSRLAAKVTMTMTIKNEVTSGTTTFSPVANSAGVSLVNANSRITLDADAPSYNPESFFNYAYYTVGKGLSNPEKGETETTISTDPFYTYPLKWDISGSGDIHQPYLKIQLPWTQTAGTSKNYFYKIVIPGLEDGSFEKFERNHWYHIDLNVAILGTEFEEGAIQVDGNIFIMDWCDTSTEFSLTDLAELSGKYLYIPQKKYTIYSINELAIPVVSSHELTSVTVSGVTKNDYSTVTPTLNKDVTDTYLSKTEDVFSVTVSGKDVINFKNVLTTLSSLDQTNMDVSPITFQIRVTNKVGLTADVTVEQVPPIVITHEYNSAQYGNVYVNGYYRSGWSDYRAYTRYDRYNEFLGTAGSTANGSQNNANPNMYVIETSLIPASMNYIIADPRLSKVNNLGYADRTNPENWSYYTGGKRLSNYYPTDDSEIAKSKISPKFRIASSHGKLGAYNNSLSYYLIEFAEAQMRCASYQEAGYPAGRWRVPTKAEIEFMITLSNKKVIPSLFTEESPNSWDEGGYFSADGGVVFPWDNHTIGYLTKAQIANGTYDAPKENGVRCVYDEWVWSDKVDVDTFTWGDR